MCRVFVRFRGMSSYEKFMAGRRDLLAAEKEEGELTDQSNNPAKTNSTKSDEKSSMFFLFFFFVYFYFIFSYSYVYSFCVFLWLLCFKQRQNPPRPMSYDR